MKKATILPGEQMMRCRVAAELEKQDILKKKRWKRTGGKLYHRARGFYYVIAVFGFIVYILNEFVLWAIRSVAGVSFRDDQIAFFRSNRPIVHMLLGLAMIAFIFMCAKKVDVACVLQLMVGGMTGLQMVQIAGGTYANQPLLMLLYGITLLAPVTAIILLSIRAYDRNRFKKAITKERNKLYERYGGVDEGLMDDTRWDSLLLEYETAIKNDTTPHKPAR